MSGLRLSDTGVKAQDTEGRAECCIGGRGGYCTRCTAGGREDGTAWSAGGPATVTGGAAAITRGCERTAGGMAAQNIGDSLKAGLKSQGVQQEVDPGATLEVQLVVELKPELQLL